MTLTKLNRTHTQGKDQQVLAGIKADLQTMPSLFLGGSTYTPTTLAALIQSRIDEANAVATAKATWQSAAKTYKALDAHVTTVVHDLKQLVIGAFGSTSPKLVDFGFAARKHAVRTPAEKLASAARAKATRKARGTVGPKAKLAIKGAVEPTPPATAAPARATAAPVTPQPAAVAPVQTAALAAASATNAAPVMALESAPAPAPTVTADVTPAAAPRAAAAQTAPAASAAPAEVAATKA